MGRGVSRATEAWAGTEERGVGFTTKGGVASTFSRIPEELSISQSAATATAGERQNYNYKKMNLIK